MFPRKSSSLQSSQSTTPKQEVVLLDEGWEPTLYVAVGLRKAGCAVHIVTATREERMDVKYLGREITRELVPPVGSEEYIRSIGVALAGRPSAGVLALTEAVLYRLWDADPSWLHRIYPGFPLWQRELLRDKARLSDYVANAGVRIPEQRPISSAADVDTTIQALGLPVVVKGGTGRGGATVRIANTAQEAVQAVAEITKSGNCFLQQYIVGPTFLVGGLFRDGEPLRIYAGEKVECSHPTGPSFRLRSVDDAALIAHALAPFRALRWSGLASVDTMLGQDGNYYFIEFNPRPWGSIAASAQTGVDLFGPLAGLLSGHMPTPDLSFAQGIETTLFPQVAKARLRGAGFIRSLACLLREPRIWLGAPWRDPGLVVHLARHIWWSWRKGQLASIRRTTASAQPNETAQISRQEEI